MSSTTAWYRNAWSSSTTLVRTNNTRSTPTLVRDSNTWSSTTLVSDDTWLTLGRRFRSVTRGTVTVGQRQRGTVTLGRHHWSAAARDVWEDDWSLTCIESVVKWYCCQPQTPSSTSDVFPVSRGLKYFRNKSASLYQLLSKLRQHTTKDIA